MSGSGSPRRSCRLGKEDPAGGGGVAAAVPARPVVSDFGPALTQFLGSDQGLSAATITRLTEQWQDEAVAFGDRSLAEVDYVYVWVDGIHLKVRLEQDKVCLLVMIGVRADGRKELIALADGYRDRASRGPTCSATASAAACAHRCSRSATARWGSGRRSATCSPTPREQRCWWHKIGNVLAALPKSAHPGAKAALGGDLQRRGPEPRRGGGEGVRRSTTAAKWPKAAAKITDDLDVLLAFYDYPAEHWIHLRTTNPIESTFATVRLRQRVTKGPGSRAAGVAMAFKLIESAQTRWRAVNAPHLVALVRAGAHVRQRQTRRTTRRPESGCDQQVA